MSKPLRASPEEGRRTVKEKSGGGRKLTLEARGPYDPQIRRKVRRDEERNDRVADEVKDGLMTKGPVARTPSGKERMPFTTRHHQKKICSEGSGELPIRNSRKKRER